MIKTTVVSFIDTRQVIDRLVGKDRTKAKTFLANELVTATDQYVPFRDGYLKNSATISIDGGFIQYNMPYARRLYYGDGFNFKGAPIRGSRWVDRSWSVNGDSILNAVEKYIARGI